MKRIISLIMSVLMIATMFCGLTATADDVYDAASELAVITVVAGDVEDDGTFEVNYWVKDLSPYGYYFAGFAVTWDEENVEPIKNEDGYIVKQTNMYLWMEAANDVKSSTKCAPDVANDIREGSDGELYTDAENNYLSIASAASGLRKNALCWRDDYMTDHEVDTSYFEYDADLGILWGTATFKLIGETAEMGVAVGDFGAAIDDASDKKYSFDGKSASRVTVVTDTVGSVAEAPELPEGITMSVSEDVSIRTADPAGMRFVANVTATDFSVIDEMGVAIVKNGEVPGVGKTLKIPARVDMSGNYLHQYIQDETGAITGFVPGITATGSATYSGVLSNIKDANRSVNFDAYAYVVIDGNVFYSDACETENYNNILGLAEGDDTIAE